MRQQDVIKALVEGWAKDHHERGGDFGSFATLLHGVLGSLDGQGTEGKATKLYNYFGAWALRAVRQWKDEPLVSFGERYQLRGETNDPPRRIHLLLGDWE